MTRIRIETPSGGRFEHTLEPGNYILGREDSCDLPIHSPEVSRRHVQLTLGPDQCTVEDLGSTSGTFHQDQRLEGPRSFPYPLHLKLGTVKLTVGVQAQAKDEDTLAAEGTIAGNPDAPVRVRAADAPAGHYTKGKEIARGGMGAVLEANDQLLGRTVAMKVIRLDLSDSESVRLRFIREATVLARLEHPNIVPIHEMGKDSHGRLFYTMKKVEGRTLQGILDEIKKGDSDTLRAYPLDTLVTIFRKVCDAMAFAHAKGVIHRDLKPENVMIGAYGEVLVMDWGLAKVLHDVAQTAQEIAATQAGSTPSGPATQLPSGFAELSDSQLRGSSQNLTMDGAVMGSPQYMPPEQAEGKVSEIDERSDVFSLGGILYTILTLRPPVEGRTVQEVLTNVKSGNITPPIQFNPGSSQAHGKRLPRGSVQDPARTATLPHCPGGRVPAGLSAVAMKALAADPEVRYGVVGALSEDVAKFQGGFATSAENLSAAGQLQLFVKRHKAVSLAAGVAGLLIVGLSAGFMLKVTAEKERAEAGEQAAEAAANTALKAEAKAAAEASNARAAERKALEALARSSLSLAEAALREGNGPGMQAALEAVPMDQRDSTWRYLWGQSDTSITNFTIQASIVGLAPHPVLPHVFALLEGGHKITFQNVRSGARLLDIPIQPPQHSGSIALSPDGKRLAFGAWSQESSLTIHDARTGNILKSWPGGHTVGLAFGPDGRRLLQWRRIGDHKLLLWEAGTGKLLWSVPIPNVVTSAHFTEDGQFVYVAGGDQFPELRHIEDGRIARKLGNYRARTASALHPDKTILVAAGRGGEAVGQDWMTDKRLFTIQAGNQSIRHITFTSAGSRFITLQDSPEGRQDIRLWDTMRGYALQRLLGGIGNANRMEVHPVSGELMVCGFHNTVWDLAPPLWSFEDAERASIAFWTEDIVFSTGRTAQDCRFYQLVAPGSSKAPQSGVPQDRDRLGTRPSLAELSPDRSLLILGRSLFYEPLRVISRATPEAEPLEIPLPPEFRLKDAHISPDNHQLAVYSEFKRSMDLLSLDPDATQTPKRVELDKAEVNDFGWLSASRLLGLLTAGGPRATPNSREEIVIWDAQTGQALRRMPHPTSADTLAIAPDHTRFAEAGGDKRVRIRDAETLEILQEFRVHEAAVTALAWHPTRPILVTGSDDLTIRLWDLNSQRQLGQIMGLFAAPESFAFSPSGSRLGCASKNGSSYIWEPKSLNGLPDAKGPTPLEKEWFHLAK